MHNRELNALQFKRIRVSHLENATPFYTVKYGAVLGSATISTSSWTTNNSNLSITNKTKTNTTAAAKFTASAPGIYTAINKITDSDGEDIERIITFVFNSNERDITSRLYSGSAPTTGLADLIARTVVNVKDPAYGAIGDGVTDDTEAIRSAIETGPNVTVYFPAGTYLVTSTIIISGKATYLVGDGDQVTFIQFDPTANDVCLFFQAAASAVYFLGGVKGIHFTSTDTAWHKTAILLEDTSGIILEGLGCSAWTDTGYDSIFLHTKGREFLITKRLYLNCDLGIQIDQNPNVSRSTVLDCDHFHFQDSYITVTSGADTPCVRVMDGVNLSNVTFDGANPWVRPGGHGFEWIDTSATVDSFNLQFSGVRVEQGQDGTKYSFYIDRNDKLKNVTIINPYLAIALNGFFFRNCHRVTIIGGQHTRASGVALNVDATCDNVKSINTEYQSSSTATTAGMETMFGLSKVVSGSPLPDNFHLVASAANTWAQDGIEIFNAKKWSWAGQLADGVEYEIPASTANGVDVAIVTVWGYSSTGPVREGGIAAVDGSGTVIISGTTNFTATTGAGDLAIYNSGSVVRVKNDTGQLLDVVINAEYKI